MLKQSPSRNLRAGRGYKVKHVAQICLVLAVTMWMLYQVWHCHYNNNVGLDEQRGGGGYGVEGKLGRKGMMMMMHGRVVEDEEEGIGDEFEQVDDLMEEQELEDKEDNQSEDVVVFESFRNETVRDR